MCGTHVSTTNAAFAESGKNFLPNSATRLKNPLVPAPKCTKTFILAKSLHVAFAFNSTLLMNKAGSSGVRVQNLL